MRTFNYLFAAIYILFSNVSFATSHSEAADIPFNELNWKVVLMTGDDSISAFDNARKKVAEKFEQIGMLRENLRQLSRKRSEQRDGVRPTSARNFNDALASLEVGEGDGCAIFMTSHGTRKGFYIKGQPYLTPASLDNMIETHCGSVPTILLVSACYSGVFAESNMQADNRIILTAARKDRTSFGCSPENEYTFWDGCLLTELDNSLTWNELSSNIKSCIERKESRGNFKRSYPQTRIGSDMNNMAIFHK